MTPDLEVRLGELEEALAAGPTPGPWRGCAHVAGTDADCPCRYRGDVVSEATDETLFQMGVDPGVEGNDMIAAPSLEQGYVNGRYIAAAADPTTIRALLDSRTALREAVDMGLRAHEAWAFNRGVETAKLMELFHSRARRALSDTEAPK